MNLSSFLSADRVLVNFSADSQRQAFAQLAKPLADHGIVVDFDQFVDDLVRREEEITTVMDNGVAIPHARSNAVRKLGLTVGLAPLPGLCFDGGVTAPSRLFFCIAVPAYAPTAHIPLLQRLAKFAREPQRVERLLSSKTAAVACRYLVNYKG